MHECSKVEIDEPKMIAPQNVTRNVSDWALPQYLGLGSVSSYQGATFLVRAIIPRGARVCSEIADVTVSVARSAGNAVELVIQVLPNPLHRDTYLYGSIRVTDHVLDRHIIISAERIESSTNTAHPSTADDCVLAWSAADWQDRWHTNSEASSEERERCTSQEPADPMQCTIVPSGVVFCTPSDADFSDVICAVDEQNTIDQPKSALAGRRANTSTLAASDPKTDDSRALSLAASPHAAVTDPQDVSSVHHAVVPHLVGAIAAVTLAITAMCWVAYLSSAAHENSRRAAAAAMAQLLHDAETDGGTVAWERFFSSGHVVDNLLVLELRENAESAVRSAHEHVRHARNQQVRSAPRDDWAAAAVAFEMAARTYELLAEARHGQWPEFHADCLSNAAECRASQGDIRLARADYLAAAETYDSIAGAKEGTGYEQFIQRIRHNRDDCRAQATRLRNSSLQAPSAEE